jgi:hypothetical protein
MSGKRIKVLVIIVTRKILYKPYINISIILSYFRNNNYSYLILDQKCEIE